MFILRKHNKGSVLDKYTAVIYNMLFGRRKGLSIGMITGGQTITQNGTVTQNSSIKPF